jgi:hypothetical protein
MVLLWVWTLSVSGFAGDYQRFEEHGKVGLKDAQGAVVLPASFDALGWSDGHFSLIGQITGYRQNNRWGLINLKKEFITPAEYESMTSPGGDRILVSRAVNPYINKFGCIDLQGKATVPFVYDGIQFFGLRAVVMVKEGPRYYYGLIDLNDKTILPTRYAHIEPMGSLRYAVRNFENKIALCSETGTWITEFTIDRIDAFQSDLAVIHEGWKQGAINRNGEVVVPPIYRELSVVDAKTVRARKADRWTLRNSSFVVVKQLEADQLEFADNGWARLTLDGRVGLVDDSLNWRWPLSFDGIGTIRNKMAVVRHQGKYGLQRLDHTSVLPAMFDSMVVEGRFVRVKEKWEGKKVWNLYDTVGTRRNPKAYDVIAPFNGSFFPVKHNRHWGAIDYKGHEIIACVYDSILQHVSPWVLVKFKGQYGIITEDDQWGIHPQPHTLQLVNASYLLECHDTQQILKTFDGSIVYFTENPVTIFPGFLREKLLNGKEKDVTFDGLPVPTPVVIPPPKTQTASFRESEGFIGVKRDGKFGFVDRRGRLRIANRYDTIGEFHHGLAPVMLLGKWGFINTSDQIAVQPNYEQVDDFTDGTTRVMVRGKWGIINAAGQVLLPMRYDSLHRLPTGHWMMAQDHRFGLADHRGNILIDPRFEQLQVMTDHAVRVEQNGKFGVITLEGLSIVPVQFDALEFQADRQLYLTREKTSWNTIELK